MSSEYLRSMVVGERSVDVIRQSDGDFLLGTVVNGLAYTVVVDKRLVEVCEMAGFGGDSFLFDEAKVLIQHAEHKAKKGNR